MYVLKLLKTKIDINKYIYNIKVQKKKCKHKTNILYNFGSVIKIPSYKNIFINKNMFIKWNILTKNIKLTKGLTKLLF